MLGDEQPKVFSLTARCLSGYLGGDVGRDGDDSDHRGSVVAYGSVQAEVGLTIHNRPGGRLVSQERISKRYERWPVRRELARVSPDELLGNSCVLRQAAGYIREPEVGVESREGHGECRDCAIDQRLAAPLLVVRRALPGLILKADEKSKGSPILIAHYRGGGERWKDGAVPALEESLRDISFGRTVAETFEDIVGRALTERKYHGDVLADQFVDAESHHRAERVVDDVDSERRDIDDQLTDCAALEQRLVEMLPFLQGRGMRGQSAWVEPSHHVSH